MTDEEKQLEYQNFKRAKSIFLNNYHYKTIDNDLMQNSQF